ncbi:MAG TPA: serine/threonine-protein kinase [Pyrinomonadaceae bacterium]|nr:serine/threonine-protein kinase [Pyrinomonadaceae bacterium]
MKDNSTWPNIYPDFKQPADSLIGLRIDDRYLIEKELGHGGVGVVYLARDCKLHDKPVVVKVLLEKSVQDQWLVQKFSQEKEALARVDHPGVVGILDTGELPNGMPYFVMQFVDGMSLREAVKQLPDGMELSRVASIVRQIGAALSAVHTKKIYHRDLKPENIMLQMLSRGTEQVKIVDFGIAKIKESVVAPSTVTGAATAGTIIYMSPEQLHGIKVTAASDIYSFGVIAYELVTGRRPFNPETIAHLSDMQRQGVRVKPGDLRPRLPAEAERLILKALSFAPKDRFENAAEFGDALACALLGEEETLEQRSLLTELPPTIVSVAAPSDQLKQPVSSAETVRDAVDSAPKQAQTVVRRPSARLKYAVMIAGFILLVVGAGVATKLFTSLGQNDNTDSRNQLPQRSLTYSLTVQKMRDGKPYQEPFQSSGQEIFESGYKFRLNVSGAEAGYLYVFNEGVGDNTARNSFNIIYPTPAINQGSPKLNANSSLQTNWNTFAGQPGTELFWMIWSASPVPVLEAAKDAAFKDPEGSVKDAAVMENLKSFLSKYSQSKPETTKDTAQRQTTVVIEGDVLVKLLELEHR